jgi:DNA-binding beta-propeller fold protein YncE
VIEIICYPDDDFIVFLHGQFQNPQDVAIDSLGKLYVIDTNNHRIQKFDSNGQFILVSPLATGKSGSQHSFDLIVYDKHDNHIIILDTLDLLSETFSNKMAFILSFIGKCSDFNAPYRILVTFADLENNLQSLVKLNKIIAIRPSVKKKASAETIETISELMCNIINRAPV